MWEFRSYTPELASIWNEFVRNSRNATFLFERGYMDYHADRFEDCSLMAYRNGKLAAVLPANLSDMTLYSHQGLTYGGWVLPPSGVDCSDLVLLWRKWMEWCRLEGIESVLYKPLPYIYATMPSQEDLYLLFLSGAQLMRSEISSTLILGHNPGFNKLQKRHLAHTPRDIEIISTDSSNEDKSRIIEAFYNLLCNCLEDRHSASPVHSLEELVLLAERFPTNIEFWLLCIENRPMAGVCLYKTSVCCHCQYIATSKEGRDKNLLPALFHHLIEKASDEDYRFFDFGTSNEDGGRKLNAGLNRQKTSFGASGVVLQQWRIDTGNALDALS